MALQFCIICIIILFAGNATAVFEIEVLNQETVEGVRDGSLTLKWMFKNIKEDYIIFSSNLYFNVVNASTTAVICNWNTSSQTPTVSAIGQQKFGTRISVSYATFIYTFTITNLKYEDAGPYLLEAGVSPGGIIGIQGSSSIIIISKVIGGPEFCEGDLESSYNFSNNVDQVIRVTLCGAPAPDLEWKLNDSAFMLANRTAINGYKYKYLIKLLPLTQRICGRDLVLNVSGNKTFEIRRPVFLTNFKPGPVLNIQFYSDVASEWSHCVKWELLDTGCEVEYNIQFLDSKNASLGSVTIMGNNKLFCTNNFTDASSVIMWATFNDTKGDNSELIFRETTTTTTTATTTTTVTTPTEGTEKVGEGGKPNSHSTTIIIIVVIVVLVFFGVTVAVIIIIKKKMKGGNVKSKKSEDDVVELKPPSYTDEGDYASVDAMQKKAAEDHNPDQMLYAELGAGGGRKGPKSEPMESNYAQVKVDEMGYPARGPASDMSEPPQYPTSINRDRSRRNSPPPHYGGLDDDDGVIV